MYYAGTGGKLKGIATFVSLPIKYAIDIAQIVKYSGLNNGHTYEPSGNDVFNILDTNIFLLNTVINDDQRLVEELNLKTGKTSIVLDFKNLFEFSNPRARIKI